LSAATALRTPAWLLHGATGSEPGILELVGDRLAFTTPDRQAFDAHLGNVSDVVFPRHYFGGGMKLKVDGEKFRVSFVKPNGAEVLEARLLAELGSPLAFLTVGQKVSDIGTGRAAGKAWKQALGA
jgi:hypothetical protein